MRSDLLHRDAVGSARRIVFGMAMLAATWASAAALAAPGTVALRFEQVFSTTGEPPALHYRATYAAQGTTHRLEVWRDGDRRLVRRTDDAIETHVARVDGSAAYQMVVLDLRRKIETRVTRDDLYRIGNFTDWFDLAHGLRYPQGRYRLTALPATDTPKQATALACRWYVLEQGAARTRICWSAREQLPIAMLDDHDRPVWQIQDVSRARAPNAVFEIRDQGYIRNDASRDISGD